MFLLRRDEGIESLTYFRLAAKTKSNDGRREALQKHLRTCMGDESFERLRTAIREANITKGGFEGEPDLFCWNPENGAWFFAEAKGDDRLTATQRRWFAVWQRNTPWCHHQGLSGQTTCHKNLVIQWQVRGRWQEAEAGLDSV